LRPCLNDFMDKRSILGLVLIAGIMIIFSFLNKSESEEETSEDKKPQKRTQISEETAKDTLQPIVAPEVIVQEFDSVYFDKFKTDILADSAMIANLDDELSKDSIINALAMAKYNTWVDGKVAKSKTDENRKTYGAFYTAAQGTAEDYVLENDLMRVTFSTKGAQVKRVELKEYRSYNAYNQDISAEEQALVIIDSTNKFRANIQEFDGENVIDLWTDDLYFSDVKQSENSIQFTARTDNNGFITYSYTLSEDKDFELKHKINTGGLSANTEFKNLKWSMKARHNEKSRSQENQVAGVFYKYNEDSRDLLTEASDDEEEIEASLDWVAFKQPFFSTVLITEGNIEKGGDLSHYIIEEGDYIKEYEANFKRSGIITNGETEYTWYIGPNDYDNFEAYDLGMHKIMNHGWKIFGWINRNFFLPLYQWLDGFGLNQGIIILLMTLIVRMLTTPLVFRNYRSSAKMRLLKPEIEEISKKFPDKADAMKKQQATMALYRSTGVSPLAGCLPMLIQMPILFAMFRLVPTLLELRQEAFLWADDLSSFDAIATWSAEIPILSGIYGNHISLFTLLMAASTMAYTMINMNQMSASQQPGMPNMKVIMYLFPIMMIFFFNNYSSGLSYYYFLSSLLSMGVMLAIKKYFIDEGKLMTQIQDNKKKPKKKSRFQQKMEEMQRQQNQKKR